MIRRRIVEPASFRELGDHPVVASRLCIRGNAQSFSNPASICYDIIGLVCSATCSTTVDTASIPRRGSPGCCEFRKRESSGKRPKPLQASSTVLRSNVMSTRRNRAAPTFPVRSRCPAHLPTRRHHARTFPERWSTRLPCTSRSGVRLHQIFFQAAL